MDTAVQKALSPGVVQSVLGDISVQDTIHDFWDGGRGEANPINDESLLQLRNDIQTLSRDVTGKDIPTVTLGEIKQKGDGTWIGKPSEYERNLIRKYENAYPSHLYAKTKEVITYRQILNDDGSLQKKYMNNRGYVNIVSIIPDPNEYFDSFTQSEKNVIANFILSFMFGLDTTAIGKSTFGITYDAGPVAPRKVFADIEQMYNYIYPQNITDSAATSFKSKKIQYVFPKDSTIRSNRFTQDVVTIAFQDKGYGPLNRYGFDWVFQFGSKSYIVPFGPTQSDGPSVNYLVTSYLNGPARGFREKNTIANISPIQPIYNAKKGIIFDLKRSGDFEQVHASLNDNNVIFATIDHLCSFYARMLHKPCIWSNNASSEIVMYRFDVGEVDPLEDFKRQAVFFAQEQLQRLQLLTSIKNNAATDIVNAKKEFRRAMKAYYVTATKSIEAAKTFIDTPSGYSASTVDTQGYLADALTTAFLRAKSEDVYEYLDSLETTITSFPLSLKPEDYTAFAQKMEALVTNPADFTVSIVQQRYTLTYRGIAGLEQQIKYIKQELEQIKPIVDLQLTNQPFFIPLITPAGTYNHKANNPLFDFSSGHFKSIHSAFRALVGIVFSGRAGRDRDKKAAKFLTDYFTARETLLGTFHDKEKAEQIRTASDILMTDVISEATLPVLGTKAIEMTRKMYEDTVPLSGGGNDDIGIHYGGVQPPPLIGQTNDLELLFRDICGKAAAYVESMITTNPDTDSGNNRDRLFAVLTNPVSQEILQDIAVHWETELMRIREDSMDNYGHNYVLTQTDVFISMLLSTYSSSPGVASIQSYLVDTPIPSRDMPQYQDYFGALLSATVPEVRNLLVLTIFDNMLTQKTDKYLKKLTPLATTSYAAPEEWKKLAQHLQTIVTAVNNFTLPTEVKGLFRGGRRPLFTSP